MIPKYVVYYHTLRFQVQNYGLSSFTIQQITNYSYFPRHYKLVIRDKFLNFVNICVSVSEEFQ
jgi:hypothetical protein